MVSISTVTLIVYFHIDSETLIEHSDKEILGHACALQFKDGFFNQTAEMWSPEGKSLATTSLVELIGLLSKENSPSNFHRKYTIYCIMMSVHIERGSEL